MLAADAEASESVRGQALLKIDELKQYLTTNMSTGEPLQKSQHAFWPCTDKRVCKKSG